jgi:hypothetical protein
MSNPDETSDPARIVADEASGERAKARRVMDAGELYMIGTPDDMATGSNMVMLEPPMNGEDVRLVRKRVNDMRDYWDSSDVTTLMADCDGALDTIERLQRDNVVLRKIAQAVADGEVYHDSRGGMLIVATPDALVTQARALLADTSTTTD